MPYVVPTLPSDGDAANASDISTPINQITAVVNGNIDSTNLADASVTAAKIVDASITSAKLATTAGEIGGAWTAWTPTWTNLTAGNGTITARYTKTGKTVKGYLRVTFGSTTTIGSAPTFTLPVSAASHYNTPNNQIAYGYAEDAGTAAYNIVVFVDNSTTVGLLRIAAASGAYVANANGISSTVPFTWATGDYFNATFEYEAA